MREASHAINTASGGRGTLENKTETCTRLVRKTTTNAVIGENLEDRTTVEGYERMREVCEAEDGSPEEGERDREVLEGENMISRRRNIKQRTDKPCFGEPSTVFEEGVVYELSATLYIVNGSISETNEERYETNVKPGV